MQRLLLLNTTDPNLVNLPPEILARIISFLPRQAIICLMANRLLRAECEYHLYRTISLRHNPNRTVRLLETFLLRPDLAAHVRNLEIDLGSVEYGLLPEDDSLVEHESTQHVVRGLALATNVRSFSDSGGSNWIWNPYMTELRDVVFGMKLTSLNVDNINEPGYFCCGFLSTCEPDPLPGFDPNMDYGGKIAELLQAQPLLEHLGLGNYVFRSKVVDSLESKLEVTSIPRLTSLATRCWNIPVFLLPSRKVEGLDLVLRVADLGTDNIKRLENSVPLGVRTLVRKLKLRANQADKSFWADLLRIFSIFPSVEVLLVIVDCVAISNGSGASSSDTLPSPREIIECVSTFAELRELDIQFATRRSWILESLKLDETEIRDLKTRCHLLERVEDSYGQLWELSRNGKDGMKELQIVGRLEPRVAVSEADLPDGVVKE